MGEIAEMMLDGTLCAGCGDFMSDDPPGYPCYCRDCGRDQKAERKKATAAAHELHMSRQKKCKCPTCGRKVKEVGLSDHMRDAHGVT